MFCWDFYLVQKLGKQNSSKKGILLFSLRFFFFFSFGDETWACVGLSLTRDVLSEKDIFLTRKALFKQVYLALSMNFIKLINVIYQKADKVKLKIRINYSKKTSNDNMISLLKRAIAQVP